MLSILISASVLLLSLAQIGQWISKHVQTGNIIRHEPSMSTETYKCHQDYTVEILSFDPWVIYINNFIRAEEISHLLEISQVFPANHFLTLNYD